MICLIHAWTDSSKFFNATLIDFDSAHDWIEVWSIFNTEWMFSLDFCTFIHCIDEIDEAILKVFFGLNDPDFNEFTLYNFLEIPITMIFFLKLFSNHIFGEFVSREITLVTSP